MSRRCKLQTIPACLAQSILHQQQDLSILLYFRFGSNISEGSEFFLTKYLLQMKNKYLLQMKNTYLLQMKIIFL